MSYQVVIEAAAQKELVRLPKIDAARVVAAAFKLADNPRPNGCVKLKGHASTYRIRIGRWRVVYTIQDDRLIVLVLTIAHRREVYRGL